MSRSNNKIDQPTFSRQVLREDIKEYLIDAILHGQYQPGDRLTETALARQLGVSQAPIREALAHLELMGFVESVPYKGTYVRKHSPAELRDIYTVRAWLEALAGYLAATRLTDGDIAELESLAARMMAHAQAGNAHDFAKDDFAFHKVIICAAANNMLLRLFDMLQFAYWTFASTIMFNYDLTYLAGRHFRVLDALRQRDATLAAQALQEHIEGLIVPFAAESGNSDPVPGHLSAACAAEWSRILASNQCELDSESKSSSNQTTN